MLFISICRDFAVVIDFLFLKACSLAQRRIKDFFADSKAFGSYFKQLVRIDKVKRLLQT